MALRLTEMCFWPANSRKNLKFLRCIHVFDLVLKYCSDINEEKWLHLLFYFLVLIDIVASVFGMSIFYLCSRYQVWVILYCSVTDGFAIGFQNWFDHDWVLFGDFYWTMRRFVDFIPAWTEIFMKWSVVFLFRRHQIFSIVSLSGFLACFLYLLKLFSSRIL